MDNFFIRKHVRNILSEFRNSAGVYAYGLNKFPYLDGTEAKTPSDLDAEFKEELEESEIDNIPETPEEKVEKNPIIPNKH